MSSPAVAVTPEITPETLAEWKKGTPRGYQRKLDKLYARWKEEMEGELARLRYYLAQAHEAEEKVHQILQKATADEGAIHLEKQDTEVTK